MGILASRELRSRLAHEDPKKRLFLAPLLEEDEQIRESQACVDIKLGTEFRIAVPALGDAVDTLEKGEWTTSRSYSRFYVPLGSYIVAHPHQLLLGQSIEYMRFPYDLAGYVVGRSSWGRLGLIVATAVGIHPNFSGVLTLELRNLGELPLRLYPGDTIAQLFVHEVSGGQPIGVSGSQFEGATSPRLGKLRYSRTEEKLKKLRSLYRERTNST